MMIAGIAPPNQKPNKLQSVVTMIAIMPLSKTANGGNIMHNKIRVADIIFQITNKIFHLCACI